MGAKRGQSRADHDTLYPPTRLTATNLETTTHKLQLPRDEEVV
jgi:hypothetical protein